MKYDGQSYDSVDAVIKVLGGGPSRPVPSRVPTPPPSGRSGAPKKAGGWALGTRVKHPKYGEGTVYRREGEGENAKLTVQFQRFGLKKLVEKYAQLEKA